MKYQLLRNFLISSLLLTFPLLRAETALKNEETTSFRVRKEVKHQVIDNFGASDAWRIAFIGKYWPTCCSVQKWMRTGIRLVLD